MLIRVGPNADGVSRDLDYRQEPMGRGRLSR